SNGWGVPMATDIAFSLGVLSLLGKRAPLSLRIFLTALAIIDDLGGILTIAIFYASAIQWNYLLMAGGIMVILSIFNIIKLRFHAVYIALGLVLWYFIFNSGVHATIAGVLLAFTIPLHRIGRLEHALHDPVSFIILPLFALANTAILLPGNFGSILGSPVNYGILCGLVIGKPLGIFLFSRAAVAFNLTTLPGDLKWMHVLGMGMIAGVGFTMSIFMSTLAFGIPEVQTIAKVSVLIASLIAGIAGFVFLTVTVKKKAAIGG
ncbi:MAG: Na+/H+ antiporter NhaA, partial [Sphingobacteriales bacterium]